MDFRQLRCFISVAEHLNFTEAAKQLYLTQSAVSYQITELENELNLKLFFREKPLVRLTAAGRVFVEEARALVSKADEALSKVQRASIGTVGKLEIGLLGSVERKFLSKIIKAFNQIYPDIQINLHRKSLSQINNAIENGSLDIAFTISLGLDQHPNFYYHKLYSDVATVVMSLDHPWALKKKLHIADLKNEPIIEFDEQSNKEGRDWLVSLCNKQGFTPKIIRITSDLENLLFIVEANQGVSIHARHIIEPYTNFKICCVDLEDKDSRLDAVVIFLKSQDNPTIPLFLEFLNEFLNLTCWEKDNLPFLI